MRHLLIDTDPGTDDAVALVMALRNLCVTIEAITVVAGNVSLSKASQNALHIVQLCKKNIPIYLGEKKPLKKNLRTAENYHGKNGLGNIKTNIDKNITAEENAIDIIIEKVYQFSGKLEIIAIGPLTNIAKAILKDHTIVTHIKKCFIMGGAAFGKGNITPFSEFNFWSDPEAAQIVLQSGLEVTLIDWNLTKKYAWFDSETIKEIRKINTKFAHCE